jgi:hypothetical protein
MTRVVSVGRSKGLFVASILGLGLLASVTGCPGTLENPQSFPAPVSGAAGTTGAAGTGSAAGTTGAAGTGGGMVTGDCDAMPIFTSRSCSIDGSCHGAAPNNAAGFDMKTAGWETKLVGTMPKGGGSGATASVCMAAGIPYIVSKSNPAQGLLIDKLTKAAPPCGAAMPSIGDPLNATEKDCLIKWATTLANK